MSSFTPSKKHRKLRLKRGVLILIIAVLVPLTTYFLLPLFHSPTITLSSMGINSISNPGFENEGSWIFTSANPYGRAERSHDIAFRGSYSGRMEILKPMQAASAEPSISQSLGGLKVNALADYSESFGLEMFVNHFANISETDGIEQIWITISSQQGRELSYIWADFPLQGWNSSSHVYQGNREVPKGTWFPIERNLRRDWLGSGFPANDSLTLFSVSINEPGTTAQGTDAAWIDEVHLYLTQSPSSVSETYVEPEIVIVVRLSLCPESPTFATTSKIVMLSVGPSGRIELGQ